MKNNKVIPLIVSPLDTFDDFKLPNTPLKEKYIATDESPNFKENSFKTHQIREKKTLPLTLIQALSKTPSTMFEGNEKESPNFKTISQMYYAYFKGLLNEENPVKETEPDEIEVLEESIEEQYERMMEESENDKNQSIYVTKRPDFDLLKLYSDSYPLLEQRRKVMFCKT